MQVRLDSSQAHPTSRQNLTNGLTVELEIAPPRLNPHKQNVQRVSGVSQIWGRKSSALQTEKFIDIGTQFPPASEGEKLISTRYLQSFSAPITLH